MDHHAGLVSSSAQNKPDFRNQNNPPVLPSPFPDLIRCGHAAAFTMNSRSLFSNLSAAASKPSHIITPPLEMGVNQSTMHPASDDEMQDVGEGNSDSVDATFAPNLTAGTTITANNYRCRHDQFNRANPVVASDDEIMRDGTLESGSTIPTATSIFNPSAVEINNTTSTDQPPQCGRINPMIAIDDESMCDASLESGSTTPTPTATITPTPSLAADTTAPTTTTTDHHNDNNHNPPAPPHQPPPPPPATHPPD
jgi:hypothetical protein